MTKKIQMIGLKFGKLTVIQEVSPDKNGKLRYKCLCDCGNEKVVLGEKLRSGDVKSCGCLNKERLMKRNTTHGFSKERLYSVWLSMKKRCYYEKSSKYKNYGGRGITVCDEWRNNYVAFREFMLSNGYDEEAPRGFYTIERKDVNGNYCPANCEVVSMQEQMYNRTDSHKEEYLGEIKTIAEWSKEHNISYNTVFKRLQRGWSLNDALNTPKKEAELFECSGEKHTLKEWSTILGIPWSTLRNQKNKGTLNIESLVKRKL